MAVDGYNHGIPTPMFAGIWGPYNYGELSSLSLELRL